MTQLSKKVIDSLAWYTFDYRKIKDEHKYDAGHEAEYAKRVKQLI